MICENPPTEPTEAPPDLIILHWRRGTRFGFERSDLPAVAVALSETWKCDLGTAIDIFSDVIGCMVAMPQLEPALMGEEHLTAEPP